MRTPLLIRPVLPFVALFTLVIAATLLIDYILHRFDLVFIGRYLGVIGTGIILSSFVYSLRKRKLITSGSPKDLLLLHEQLALVGSVLILVHAGIHISAWLPWLATALLLINVASGLVGKYLLKNASITLAERRKELRDTGVSNEEVDKVLWWDLITVDAMKQWRVVHLPIASMLAALTLLHILTILIYRS